MTKLSDLNKKIKNKRYQSLEPRCSRFSFPRILKRTKQQMLSSLQIAWENSLRVVARVRKNACWEREGAESHIRKSTTPKRGIVTWRRNQHETQGEGELVVEKRRKGSMLQESRGKKRRLSDMMASGPGDSAGDHQETVLVNEALVEGHSTLRTERVTQQDSSTELLYGDVLSRLVEEILRTPLPGTSNSQSQHHVAGTEHEALPATIASELVPLPNESHSGVIPSTLVNKSSVNSQPTLETEGDTTMNHADMQELLNMDAETGKEHDTVMSTRRSETVGDLIAPLSIESRYEAIQLPFEKCSFMWQYIDSQVMPKMRRQPHFRPLEQSSEVMREGIAVSLVVTYENLMKGKGCLKLDSSCHNLDETIMAVNNLQENGFDVQDIRANLEELRRVKRNREQLLENKSETQAQAVEIQTKISHLNVELEETDKAVIALKQALKLFDERKTSVRKQMEETETLNAEVQRDLKSAEEELVSVEGRLQELLTAVRSR